MQYLTTVGDRNGNAKREMEEMVDTIELVMQ